MSKKLVDHLIKTNYNGIKDKIKAFQKAKKRTHKSTGKGNSRNTR